jgi:hypothetical protein
VIRLHLAPECCSSAFDPIVVPCKTSMLSETDGLAIQGSAANPREQPFQDEGGDNLVEKIRPDSSGRATSVKVPPISTETRIRPIYQPQLAVRSTATPA